MLIAETEKDIERIKQYVNKILYNSMKKSHEKGRDLATKEVKTQDGKVIPLCQWYIETQSTEEEKFRAFISIAKNLTYLNYGQRLKALVPLIKLYAWTEKLKQADLEESYRDRLLAAVNPCDKELGSDGLKNLFKAACEESTSSSPSPSSYNQVAKRLSADSQPSSKRQKTNPSEDSTKITESNPNSNHVTATSTPHSLQTIFRPNISVVRTPLIGSMRPPIVTLLDYGTLSGYSASTTGNTASPPVLQRS